MIEIDRSGWRRVRFGDVVTNTKETVKDPVGVGLDRVVALEHMEPGSLQLSGWQDAADGTTFTRRFRAGQTLFAKRRAYQRKVAYAEFDGVCSGDILVLEAKPDELLPELLPFIVQSDAFFEHALRTSAGSLSPRTKWQDLAKWEFEIPRQPDEQREIADLLWSLEAARRAESRRLEALETAQKGLAEGFTHDTQSLGSLVQDGVLSFLTGPFGTSLSASEYIDDGIPVIHPSNIVNGVIHPDSRVGVSESTAARLARWLVREGDLVLMRKGDVGRSALVGADQAGWVLGSDCISIRVLDRAKILPAFLRFGLARRSAMRELLMRAPGTTMPGISEKSLRPIPLPTPSLDVQVAVLEQHQELADCRTAMIADLESTKTLAAALSARLFGGER